MADSLSTTGDEAAAGAPLAGGAVGADLVFDVSDLFGYFPDNRLPTGVQRVQASVVLAMLDKHRDGRIALVRFVEILDEWLTVPTDLFRETILLSMAGGDPAEPAWRDAVARLEKAIMASPAHAFARGATLVSLGTSWWSPNYFMFIRRAKDAHGIRFVPMIYDVIPVVCPQHCAADLVNEFINWLMGVTSHGDQFIAISDATKADFVRVAAGLGRTVEEDRVAVLPLQAGVDDGGGVTATDVRGTLARHGLRAGDYVLLVSTVESRKNQVAAFDAWQALINAHGADAIPQLVCVGKRGFRYKSVVERLEQSVELDRKVTVLHNIDDAELATLYRNCRFTLYPSHYEGWGLPVTEALAFGKVPLTADNSSLPQAGQGLSVTFRSGSRTAFMEALEPLLFDDDMLHAREERIAREFTIRGWHDIADDLDRLLARFAASGDPPKAWTAPRAGPGYHPLSRNRAAALRPDNDIAEMYRIDGFWRLEDFGCWTMPRGGTLRFQLDPGPQRLAVRVNGLPDHATEFLLETGDGSRARGSLPAQVQRWAFIDIPGERPPGPTTLRVSSLRSEVAVDHGLAKGRDIGLGVQGLYVLDAAAPNPRLAFLEALSLGSLQAAGPR